jgi:competence protein ComEC
MRLLAGILISLASAAVLPAAKSLDFYFIDVEGGQSTLIVTPSKQSLLVDAGWPGFNRRDSTRIAEAAKKAGVKQIDYLVITHFHTDHAGGVPQLVEKLPVKHVIDHGSNVETSKAAKELTDAYNTAIKASEHITMKPGDKIPLKGLDITVVAANGEHIDAALPGAGQPNQYCDTSKTYPADRSENARSLGFVLNFGKFRFIDLGDLTAAKELGLVCPNNLIGQVSLYLTSHHGLDASNTKEMVWALHPRVAVMNNGATKGGMPKAWQVVKTSPDLEDLWQVHFSVAGGKDNNVPDPMIANIDETTGDYIKVSAMPDGSFTVWNSRNKFTKTYNAK